MRTETGFLLTAFLIVGLVASLHTRAVMAMSVAKRQADGDSASQSQASNPRSSPSGPEVATLEIRISLRSGQPKELEPAYRFLWTHWTERRAARVTVTFYGTDAGVRHIVTIRRGARGVWQMEEHRRYYAARQRTEQAAALLRTARKVRAVESADSGFTLELVGPSGEAGRLFAVENWPRR